jgi:hypothetical protein
LHTNPHSRADPDTAKQENASLATNLPAIQQVGHIFIQKKLFAEAELPSATLPFCFLGIDFIVTNGSLNEHCERI